MHIYTRIYTEDQQQKHAASNFRLHLILDLIINMTVIRKEEYIMKWVLSTANILLQCILSDIRASNHLNMLI